MIQEHLNFLIQIGDNEQDYIGNNSFHWANSILTNANGIDNYLNRQLTRYELFDYCNNLTNSNLNVLVAILSWGGMRRDHARLFFSHQSTLNPLIENLRNNIYQSRASAFKAFEKMRNAGHLPGLGIGYFTKLICFLSPNLNGYIMDQWVSKSINLLTGKNIVSISNKTWVNDKNDCNTYEEFCSRIDELALMLNCSGFEAEKRIFSLGRGKGAWRNYLKANYHSIETN